MFSTTLDHADLFTSALVTDGGLETDLIYHHGVELPEFAAFPLLDDARGRRLLDHYFGGYAQVAVAAGAGLLLESPTWRASADWGALVGYDAPGLRRVNEAAIIHLQEVRDQWRDRIPTIGVCGMVGPRGDAYRPAAGIEPADSADYHRPQVAALAAAGADLVTGYTLADVGEAIGIAWAANESGIPVAISFTVEQDGRLPGGRALGDAIEAVDAVAEVRYYLVNCAHPTHIGAGLTGPTGAWQHRIEGVRVNASAKSHAELDEATDLDAGDQDLLAADVRDLRDALPALRIVGGCCGTDVSHVRAMWPAAS